MSGNEIWTMKCLAVIAGLFPAVLAPHTVNAEPDSEVITFMNYYLETFDTGHAGDITELYNDPFFMIAPNGDVRTFETEKGIRREIKQWKFYMKKEGVVDSRYLELNVKALSSDVAIASAVVDRFDDDGNVLAHTGATYSLLRREGAWKVFSIQIHDPDKILRFQ